MDEKKVRLGVDPGDTESAIKRLKSSTDELFRGMISSSRAYSTSAREVLSDIENQIRALDRKNRIELEGRRANLRERMDAGTISEGQRRLETTAINDLSKENALSTKLLRELIDTVKSQAKEEIRADRENVEKRIQASKTVGERGPRGDEKEILKETIQEYELGKMQQEEIQQRGMFERGRRGLPYLSTIAGSSSIYEATAGVAQTGMGKMQQSGGALGLMGAIGFVAAMAGGKAIQASLPYEHAMGMVAGSSGLESSKFIGFGRGMADYGYTMDQAIMRRYAIGRARGSNIGADEDTMNALMIERGYSVDPGMLDQLIKLDRRSKRGIEKTFQGSIQALRGGGLIEGNDFNKVPEYLEMLVSLGNQQVKTMGRVDTSINSKFISAIGSLSDRFKDQPAYLAEAVTKIGSSLSTAPNKQTEALQFAILSKLKPSANFAELQRMRELGVETPGYMEATAGMLSQLSMGDKGLEQNYWMAYAGIGPNMAWDIAKGNKSLMRNILAGRGGKIGGELDLKGYAADATGFLTESIAKWTNSFEQTGNDLVRAMKEFGIAVDNLAIEVAKNRADTQKIGVTLMNTNKTMNTIIDMRSVGAIIYSGASDPVKTFP